MATKHDDTEHLIDLVIDRAPKLRAAGVLELGAIGLKLAPLTPEADSGGETDEEREAREEAQRRSNPWNDPATYGRENSVPGNDPRKQKG